VITATAAASWERLPSFGRFEIGRKHVVTRIFTEAEVDAFGHLSGDLNPLHMDDEFASHSPFGRRVVHGLLTAAVVSRVHTELTGPGFAYAGQELRFLKPVFIGDRITVEVTIVGKKEAKRILIMDTMVRKQTGEAVLSGLSAYKHLRFR
jgi:3-hydroxybutyryl-CoA dehydratase